MNDQFYICTVIESQGHQVKVQFKDLKTEFLPVATTRAAQTIISSPLNVGEQVLVFTPDGDLAEGIIIASLEQNQYQTEHTDGWKVQTTLGSIEIQQNKIIGSMGQSQIEVTDQQIVSTIGETSITATEVDVTVMATQTSIKSGRITLDADMTVVNGQLQCASLSGLNQNVLPIKSALSGQIKVSGDVLVNGISASNHIHPVPDGMSGIPI